MKKRFLGLGMLSAFLLAAPALAQNVDQKIQALEQELLQLKEQQIELKKEATEAAAAMPSFSYRPGNGLNIEAADKSWSFRPDDRNSLPHAVRRRARARRPYQWRDHGPSFPAGVLFLHQQLLVGARGNIRYGWFRHR